MARPAHDYARVDKHVPVTRRAETANPYSPVMILISLIATLGILLYAQFLLNPEPRRFPAVRAGDHGRDDPDHARAALNVDDLVRSEEPSRLRVLRGARRHVRQVGHRSRRAQRRRRTCGPSSSMARESPSTSSSPFTVRSSPRPGLPPARRWRSRASNAPGSWTTAAPRRCRRWPKNSTATTCGGSAAMAPSCEHQPRVVDRQRRLLLRL